MFVVGYRLRSSAAQLADNLEARAAEPYGPSVIDDARVALCFRDTAGMVPVGRGLHKSVEVQKSVES